MRGKLRFWPELARETSENMEPAVYVRGTKYLNQVWWHAPVIPRAGEQP